MIRDYFQEVEEKLSKCPFVFNHNYDHTVIDLFQGYWTSELHFQKGYLLNIFEFVNTDEEKVEIYDYRYHFQDQNKDLIFRYDNSAHHPELSTHPDHVHRPNQVLPATKPSIEEIMDEAIRSITLR